ncbi:hypothetical protein CJ030_MR7G022879 [Morella rubra]|uniref:Nucleolar 27S pre-rRNA processing Urb2/Npa2 C-terminal domain-containing protein n=1 Tax=Morella rubra TaxID=262757 RepID=A0A6A1V6Y9_9ROSI|nr:hypothetical protein CJ030_MR7G022879 [Morella rubra]
MADSEAKSKEGRAKKIKKRKLRSPEVTERPSKTLRVELSENQREQTEVERVENLEQSEPNQDILEQTWRNLQLILSIQNKELDLQKKVELAFNFVKMRLAEGGTGADQDCETVKLPRVVVFLNDWTQSLLISSEKKMKGEGEKPPAEVTETCLDFRCWEIFKFCLEESLRLQVSLNFSRNLLRLISYIAKDAVSAVNNACLCYEASSFIDERFKLYSTVIDCISLVFSSHGGLSNENLDLWMSTIHAVLELVHKIYAKNLDSGNMGVFSLRFSCLVFEPFAKFLRVHPTRKTGFHDLIDKLLEPLMHLLGVLQNHIGGCNSQWTENLLKLVEEVLSNGLFHPVHMDGFLSLHITGKYDASYDGKSKNSRTAIKSYHRHLFDYLERTLSENRVPVMGSIGELFRLVVARVKSLKRSSVLSAGTKVIGKEGASRHLEDNLLGFSSKISSASSSILLDKSYCLSTFSADARKSLFDFFVQIMEPLLLKIKTYLQVKLEVESELLEVHGTLKAINSLLASFTHERVYLRTEDTSDRACLYFLKEVYAVVISVSTNLLLSSKYNFGNHMSVDMLTLSANEVLVAVGYLVEIEYEVIGDDLVSLWLMLFSYSAIGLSLAGMLNQSLLSSKIEALGCQLINLYSQLRQVNNSVFALCKALRLVTLPDEEGEINHMMFIADLPSEAYARSVGMLLSSQEFKCAVGNAIKSIPRANK